MTNAELKIAVTLLGTMGRSTQGISDIASALLPKFSSGFLINMEFLYICVNIKYTVLLDMSSIS